MILKCEYKILNKMKIMTELEDKETEKDKFTKFFHG